MKHCELEGHLCGDTAEGGIGPFSVSFISKARGRIASFCGFSSVPTEVHHHFRLLLWDKIFGPCLYVCVRDKIIQIYTLPLYSFSQNWSCLFFSPFFGSLFLSWVAPMRHSVAAELMVGHGARTHQQWCKQRMLPGLCCESLASSVSVELSVCLCSKLGLWSTAKSTSMEGLLTSSRERGGYRN